MLPLRGLKLGVGLDSSAVCMQFGVGGLHRHALLHREASLASCTTHAAHDGSCLAARSAAPTQATLAATATIDLWRLDDCRLPLHDA